MMAPLAWAQANNAVPKGDKHCGNLVFEQVFAHQGWLDYMWGVSPDVLGMVAYDGSDDNAKDLAREIARLMKLKRGLAEIRESVQKGVVAANVLVQIGNEPLDVIVSTHEAITNPSWRTIAGALLSMLPFVPGIVGKADDVVDLGKAEDMAKSEAASVAPNSGIAVSKFPDWNIGDSITKATPEGNYPSWPTIRSRYWQNRAALDAASFGPTNRAIMEKGFAPKARAIVKDRATGELRDILVEKELHHALGNRGVPGFDDPIHLREVWPWEHESLLPPGRRLDYDFIRFE
jgi:hypothetical protein